MFKLAMHIELCVALILHPEDSSIKRTIDSCNFEDDCGEIFAIYHYLFLAISKLLGKSEEEDLEISEDNKKLLYIIINTTKKCNNLERELVWITKKRFFRKRISDKKYEKIARRFQEQGFNYWASVDNLKNVTPDDLKITVKSIARAIEEKISK